MGSQKQWTEWLESREVAVSKNNVIVERAGCVLPVDRIPGDYSMNKPVTWEIGDMVIDDPDALVDWIKEHGLEELVFETVFGQYEDYQLWLMGK